MLWENIQLQLLLEMVFLDFTRYCGDIWKVWSEKVKNTCQNVYGILPTKNRLIFDWLLKMWTFWDTAV